MGLLFSLAIDACLKIARFEGIPKAPPEPSLSALGVLLMLLMRSAWGLRNYAKITPYPGEASWELPCKISAVPMSSHTTPRDPVQRIDGKMGADEAKALWLSR